MKAKQIVMSDATAVTQHETPDDDYTSKRLRQDSF